MPDKALFAPPHLIRYEPKMQDTSSVFPEQEARSLTFDIGYPSSLVYSFVIEIQTHARMGLERIFWK